MKTILIKNSQDLSDFKKKYLWPSRYRCNKPKKYPCFIHRWDTIPMEEEYSIGYIYLDDLKEATRILEEASNA